MYNSILFVFFFTCIKNIYVTGFYNKGILQGIISKLYKIHGTSIINAITIGNNTVQQYDIN